MAEIYFNKKQDQTELKLVDERAELPELVKIFWQMMKNIDSPKTCTFKYAGPTIGFLTPEVVVNDDDEEEEKL